MEGMTLQLFWKIIDNAKNEDATYEDICETLVDILSNLEITDIITWGQIFDEYQTLSYKTKLWAAAYIINGGYSDDGFDYFRPAVMIQGKNVFLEALQNPDSLAKLDLDTDDVFECIEMLSVGCEAFIKNKILKRSLF